LFSFGFLSMYTDRTRGSISEHYTVGTWVRLVSSEVRHLHVRLPENLVRLLDELVAEGVFKDRTEAIREAVRLLLAKYGKLGGGQV